ncbi:VPLPA-CTERM sorting domain-containing protein [Roseovarius sp. EL26]|uniref:VPLPA-CTERM sorting domain-containing protein n=1 Tax=Roseovarius sp. EL26 TaxID=2126672 RepID=UPI0013C428B2|nr:VPLPA-CTERM sorting domain-containing protein [Roseovarius sp. EL26]
MYKTIAAIAVATATFASAASAATLSGTFSIDIYQRTNVDAAGASATLANVAAAGAKLDTITYTGDIDFGTFNGSDSTTIGQWLATGVNGSVLGLSAATSILQLSKPDIGSNSATATFFDITATFASAFDSVIRHDDGITLFDDGVQRVTSSAPTVVKNTFADGVNAFDGGEWRLLYVATNGDPSVLKVTGDNVPTIPLPAGLPLMFAGLGGLALLRRRSNS